MLANAEPRLLDQCPTTISKPFNNPFAIDPRKWRDVLRQASRPLTPSLPERHRLLSRSSASHEVAWHRNQGIPLWGRPGERTFVHRTARNKALVFCTINEVSRVVTGFKVING